MTDFFKKFQKLCWIWESKNMFTCQILKTEQDFKNNSPMYTFQTSTNEQEFKSR